MGGPGAGILLSREVTDAEIWPIRDPGVEVVVGERARGATFSVDFWADGWPFLISHGFDIATSKRDYERAELLDLAGWFPQDNIGISAYCSGDENHRLLAHFCLLLASRLGGIVDFGGCPYWLPPERSAYRALDPRAWSANEAAFADDIVPTLAGRCVGLPYEVDPGRTCRAFVCDTEFLRAWMNHPEFRMVK